VTRSSTGGNGDWRQPGAPASTPVTHPRLGFPGGAAIHSDDDSVVRPFAFIQEHLSELDPLGIVNVEDCNGGAAGLRTAEEDCSGPLEVAFP
jgi:hypothetical protein